MTEQRREIRYLTQAKATVEGTVKGEGILKDLSVTGCRVECSNFEGIELNVRFKVEITPEEAAKIGPFDLTVESKWIRVGNQSFEVGFIIIESPKGKLFQRYVDYLAWRYAQGNSMIGNPLGTPPLL